MTIRHQSSSEILSVLLDRFPELEVCRPAILEAFHRLLSSYQAGGKLLCCGNGGSAADCEHIAGELMKGFLLRRPLDKERRCALEAFGEDGALLASRLQGTLPCIALTGHPGLSTAFSNDVDPQLNFAQQVLGFGRFGDVLLAISTSGNARNCAFAILTAKSIGMSTIGLTGKSGGRFSELCDTAICVPAEETYRIQEYHLPIYHALCAMLEAEFFSQ